MDPPALMLAHPTVDAGPVATTFLIGAGASHEAGVPMMRDIIGDLRNSGTLSPGNMAELDKIEPRLARAARNGVVDIELLLAALERAKDLTHDLTAALLGLSRQNDLDVERVASLEASVKDWLRLRCSQTVNRASVRYLSPLLMFARSAGTLDIFSLNYDCCIETLGDDERVEVVDGFEYSWKPETLEREGTSASPLVRLHKLHGSLIWYGRPDYGWVKIPLTPPPREALTFYNGERVEEIMVYPAIEKAGRITPLTDLMQLFRRRLQETAVLVIMGYSMRDAAIMEAIDEAMTRDLRLHVIIVGPHAGDLPTRHFSQRDFLARTLAVASGAGDALRDSRLMASVNAIAEARRHIAAAEASKPSSPFQVRREYRAAVYSLMRVYLMDGVCYLVEREEEANPDRGQFGGDAHLLSDLPACCAFALVAGNRKEIWWQLMTSLTYWWEVQVANQFTLRDDDGQYTPRPGYSWSPYSAISVTDEDVDRLLEMLTTFLSHQLPGAPTAGWQHLGVLRFQLEQFRSLARAVTQPNFQELVPKVTSTLRQHPSPSELCALMAEHWRSAQPDVPLAVNWPERKIEQA